MTDQALIVGWLVWGDEVGGVPSAILSNAELLRRRGHRTLLLHLQDGIVSEEAKRRGITTVRVAHKAGSHDHYLQPGFTVRGIVRRLRVMRQLYPALLPAVRETGIKIFCIRWPDWMPLAGAVGRELGIGVVLEMPNTPSRYPLALNQRAYAWAAHRWRVKTLANSEFSARHMRRIPGVEVMPPGLDLGRFDPATIQPVSRAELGIPESAILLGQVARLDPSKGADHLIEAIAELPTDSSRPPVHLLLVGGPLTGSYVDRLRQRAAQLCLTDRVHFVDRVDDPERYWPICDLATNTRLDAEPFGRSIIEAMLMRRPVLAHALGGPADTVDDGRTGWLYHAPEVPALSAALQRALAARRDWPAMGEQARAAALAHYAGSADRYEQLLRQQAGVWSAA